MKNGKFMQALCLILFAAPMASVALGQGNQPAANGATGSPANGPLQVVCKGDQLTISANDSTLATILAEVQKCTGVRIDLPSGAAEIRFFDTLGPGPIPEVLAKLLDGTGYNFAIGSSDSNPDKVKTVLLMARAGAPGTAGAGDVAGDRSQSMKDRVFQQLRKNARPYDFPAENTAAAPEVDPVAPVAEESPAPAPPPADAAASANPAPDANQPPVPAEATPVPRDNPATTAPSVPSVPPAPSGSVDDQITNMQQLFEQRRQMMQNGNSAPH